MEKSVKQLINGSSFGMDRKRVKKLINEVKKFSTLDHFSAGLDGICLGITDVNDSFRLHANALSCRNRQSLTFPSTFSSFLSQLAKTSISPSVLIFHTVACFWLLWLRICEPNLVKTHGRSFSSTTALHSTFSKETLLIPLQCDKKTFPPHRHMLYTFRHEAHT